jgi:hypothetical protein
MVAPNRVAQLQSQSSPDLGRPIFCTSWAAQPMCELGHRRKFGPLARIRIENSYLIEYLSKIHETSSVGFLISCSIHEKYQAK